MQGRRGEKSFGEDFALVFITGCRGYVSLSVLGFQGWDTQFSSVDCWVCYVLVCDPQIIAHGLFEPVDPVFFLRFLDCFVVCGYFSFCSLWLG